MMTQLNLYTKQFPSIATARRRKEDRTRYKIFHWLVKILISVTFALFWVLAVTLVLEVEEGDSILGILGSEAAAGNRKSTSMDLLIAARLQAVCSAALKKKSPT